jgi:hypothetical protein
VGYYHPSLRDFKNTAQIFCAHFSSDSSGFNSIHPVFSLARFAVDDFHSGRRPFLFEPSAPP